MRRPPLTFAAFAAILAALGGGVTAFAAADKTVRLDVDGQQVAVRTFAGTVAGVLRKAHLDLGPHDTVAPDVGAPVHNGSRVVVRHGRLVSLVLDGRPRQVWVTALSVDAALDELGLSTRDEWVSASRSLPIPRQGLSLAVRQPQHVTVLVDGRRLAADTTAPDVATLLASLHVVLRPLDRVSTPLTTYPIEGMVVTVDRVDRRSVVRSVAIPFRTTRIRTAALYVGQSRVVHAGRPGVRVLTYQLTWKNHRLATQRLVRNVIRAQPVRAVVEVGTRARPRYTPRSDGLNWAALANCESGGNPRAVSSNGEYRGLYQFTLGTWHSLGGSGDPINASASEQTYRAQLLYRRSGDSSWPTCGHYLYS